MLNIWIHGMAVPDQQGAHPPSPGYGREKVRVMFTESWMNITVIWGCPHQDELR